MKKDQKIYYRIESNGFFTTAKDIKGAVVRHVRSLSPQEISRLLGSRIKLRKLELINNRYRVVRAWKLDIEKFLKKYDMLHLEYFRGYNN